METPDMNSGAGGMRGGQGAGRGMLGPGRGQNVNAVAGSLDRGLDLLDARGGGAMGTGPGGSRYDGRGGMGGGRGDGMMGGRGGAGGADMGGRSGAGGGMGEVYPEREGWGAGGGDSQGRKEGRFRSMVRLVNCFMVGTFSIV